MGEIAGVKGLRLLAQQPVALGPFAPDVSQGKKYFIELQFEDGSIQNIGIENAVYNQLLLNLAGQGVGTEQRMVARARMASEKIGEVVAEKPLPLDATGKEVLDALNEVVHPPPVPSNSRLLDPFGEEGEYDDNDFYDGEDD